jgi:hypothetical protein
MVGAITGGGLCSDWRGLGQVRNDVWRWVES